MNVLVTGGCGYLGSKLVDKLASEGYGVTVLDNLLYGSNGIEAKLVKGDVTDPQSVTKALRDVDAVIHLAAIVGEGAGNLRKELTVNVNYLATRYLSEVCEKKKIRLLFPSTASVYGAKSDRLLDERSDVSPLSIYAITKLAAEDTIRNNCTNYVIYRLGTIFGIIIPFIFLFDVLLIYGL